MVRKPLVAALLLTTCLSVAVPTPAHANYPVFDSIMNSTAVKALKEAKDQVKSALEQIKLLKDQLSFLNDISKFMNEVSDAIGEIATIELPIPDLLQASAQIKSDMRCLLPDGLGWGIKFTDLDLSSICSTSSKYRDALFVNQKDLEGEPFSKTTEAWAKVGKRRDALLEDSAVRGLAQSDVQIKQAERLNKTADDLQAELKKAKSLQQRQHVMDQIQLLQVQATISQNQMMAQSLKLQSIAEIKKGLPPDKVRDTTGVEDTP